MAVSAMRGLVANCHTDLAVQIPLSDVAVTLCSTTAHPSRRAFLPGRKAALALLISTKICTHPERGEG